MLFLSLLENSLCCGRVTKSRNLSSGKTSIHLTSSTPRSSFFMLTGDYRMHARDAVQPGAVGNARRRTSVSQGQLNFPLGSRCPRALSKDSAPEVYPSFSHPLCWEWSTSWTTRSGCVLTCLHWHTFWRVAAGPQSQVVFWVFTWGSGIPLTGP